ncbi:MAG: YraN family protein [Eubacterium sp.]|nr:YraN family protein [Eubacterium sp.]MBP3719525.1 YraN family protein [Eubacterium sp.]
MYESYNKRKVGKAWEKTARDYLREKGYIVLMMNYRTRYSEIDIIAETRGFLVFIEVKYRRDISSGGPFEAVDVRKQQKIRNAALEYLMKNGYDIDKTSIRFDVIGILGNSIEHIEGAF